MPTKNSTFRWRAAAASSTPWIGRCPLADGKSSVLELRRASILLHRPHRKPAPRPVASRSSKARDANLELQRREDADASSTELRRRRRQSIHSGAPPERRHRRGRSPPAELHSGRAATSPTPPAGHPRTPRLCTGRDLRIPHPPAAEAAAGE